MIKILQMDHVKKLEILKSCFNQLDRCLSNSVKKNKEAECLKKYYECRKKVLIN